MDSRFQSQLMETRPMEIPVTASIPNLKMCSPMNCMLQSLVPWIPWNSLEPSFDPNLSMRMMMVCGRTLHLFLKFSRIELYCSFVTLHIKFCASEKWVSLIQNWTLPVELSWKMGFAVAVAATGEVETRDTAFIPLIAAIALSTHTMVAVNLCQSFAWFILCSVSFFLLLTNISPLPLH